MPEGLQHQLLYFHLFHLPISMSSMFFVCLFVFPDSDGWRPKSWQFLSGWSESGRKGEGKAWFDFIPWPKPRKSIETIKTSQDSFAVIQIWRIQQILSICFKKKKWCLIILNCPWLPGFWIFSPQSFTNGRGASIEKRDSRPDNITDSQVLVLKPSYGR